MSFVPVSGPATFRPADPPRDGTVEFTDDRRTVALPVRAALPVLGRARRDDDVHPSVALIGGAALLATELVAAGKLAPADGVWHLDGLDDRDRDSIARLAAARRYDGLAPDAARGLVDDVLAAVADALPRAAPTGGRGGRQRPATSAAARESAPPPFAERLQQRVAERARRSRQEELPELVRVSLRVEADEEELAAGAVRVVLQVHDERDPLHVADAALLWSRSEAEATHGFGPRARVHASIALRSAAEVWPVLDRFLELAVPDQLTLDGEEIASLLDHVGPLREARVDVHWPRSLGRDLTTRAVLDRRGSTRREQEQPLQDSPFSVDGLFDFSWQVALHGEPLTEEEMQQLATAASPVLQLRGSWTVVDPTTAQRAKRRLIRKASGAQALAAALSGVVEVPADEGETRVTDEVVVGASLLQVRERLLAAATRDPLPAPSALRAQLRDYQRHGLTWLADLTGLGLGACLADDMGLGKTVTLIALHLHRLEQGLSDGRPTLVVCPASLLGNWEAEIERFAPGTPVRRFHASERDLSGLDTPPRTSAATRPTATEEVGSAGRAARSSSSAREARRGSSAAGVSRPRASASRDVPPTAGFVLTTYGTMRVDADALAAIPWDLVVADEAQHVKNSRSATARALRRLPSRGRVGLTGTPVENDLTELWSILDWAIPGLLGSRQAFRRVWAAPIESGAEPTKAGQFADLIGPFLLRRRKTDPGIAPELPPKTETDQILGLTREQVVLYEAFVRDSMERIERLPADDPQRRGLVLALLTGLKQICNHPAQFLKQSGAVRLGGRSEKLELLDELLGTILAEDGAVLVFTQYVAMARLIEQHLSEVGVPHQFLHGGTAVSEREAMVRRFADGAVPVFLLSLKAGGTGLNLTRADHVIHVDRWWNPAVEEQATDRAYRIGQTRPVQVHRMVTHGTIEERVAALLERKRALADAVLARGEAALTELSDEELRDLVTLRREARLEAVQEEE